MCSEALLCGLNSNGLENEKSGVFDLGLTLCGFAVVTAVFVLKFWYLQINLTFIFFADTGGQNCLK